MQYTLKELTVKTHTVGDACKIALMLLREKGYHQVCTNSVWGRPDSEPITIERLNRLVELMVDDTIHYDFWKAVK